MRNQKVVDLHEAYASIYEPHEETQNDFEAWVNDLVNEGYDLSEYTWDEMAEIYMEEVEQLDEARRADKLGYARGTAANPNRRDVPHSDPSQQTNLHSRLKRRADQMGRERRSSARYKQGGRPPLSKKEKEFLKASDRTSPSRGHVRNPNVPDTGSHAQWPSERKAQRDPKQNPRHNANKQTAAEEYDAFDYILDHLISEGYADDVDSALVMMSNMSDEWRQSIVEAYVPWDAPRYTTNSRGAQIPTGRQSPRDVSASRQRQQSSSGTQAGSARAGQISAVRANMRQGVTATQARTGVTNPAREGSAPSTQRHIRSAQTTGGSAGGRMYPPSRGVSGTPSIPIPSSPQLRRANQAAQARFNARGGRGGSGGGIGDFSPSTGRGRRPITPGLSPIPPGYRPGGYGIGGVNPV